MNLRHLLATLLAVVLAAHPALGGEPSMDRAFRPDAFVDLGAAKSDVPQEGRTIYAASPVGDFFAQVDKTLSLPRKSQVISRAAFDAGATPPSEPPPPGGPPEFVADGFMHLSIGQTDTVVPLLPKEAARTALPVEELAKCRRFIEKNPAFVGPPDAVEVQGRGQDISLILVYGDKRIPLDLFAAREVEPTDALAFLDE